MNAIVDFLETVIKGHWLASACDILGLSKLDASITLPDNIKKASPEEQLQFVHQIASKVVERLSLVDSAFFEVETENTDDKVYHYTRVLCHYGALFMEFRDAWAEGDGDRVVRCWKLFLPHFRAAGCTKYALEAFRLQLQVNVVLSPNLSHQVKWHRFVNIKGGMGRNIPCDLYNEHINKLIKIIIQNMGSNLTEASLQRAVRCVSPLNLINSNFDKESDVPVITSAHSTRSDLIDINKVVAVVLKRKLLSQVPEREHHSFRGMPLNPLHNYWDRKKTKTWVKAKIAQYAKFKGTLTEEGNESESDEFDELCDSD